MSTNRHSVFQTITQTMILYTVQWECCELYVDCSDSLFHILARISISEWIHTKIKIILLKDSYCRSLTTSQLSIFLFKDLAKKTFMFNTDIIFTLINTEKTTKTKENQERLISWIAVEWKRSLLRPEGSFSWTDLEYCCQSSMDTFIRDKLWRGWRWSLIES